MSVCLLSCAPRPFSDEHKKFLRQGFASLVFAVADATPGQVKEVSNPHVLCWQSKVQAFVPYVLVYQGDTGACVPCVLVC